MDLHQATALVTGANRGLGRELVQKLLAAGAPGKRFALPHSRVLIHQPYAEGGGQGTDIEIQAAELLRMREEMEGILAKHTGRAQSAINRDIERDKILTALDAVEYGVVDSIISSRKVAPTT